VVEQCESSLSNESLFRSLLTEQKIDYAATIAKTVLCLHDNFVVRGDLKPENVLLTSTGELRLADFGLARTMRSLTLVTKSAKGTPNYAPPETMDDEQEHKVTEKTDVYCFGGVLLYLFTGKPPHSGLSQIQIVTRLLVNKKLPAELDLLKKGQKSWRQPLCELVSSCLSFVPDSRPSMKSVLASLCSIFNGSFVFCNVPRLCDSSVFLLLSFFSCVFPSLPSILAYSFLCSFSCFCFLLF
jgi:serine/threonine protein kinase